MATHSKASNNMAGTKPDAPQLHPAAAEAKIAATFDNYTGYVGLLDVTTVSDWAKPAVANIGGTTKPATPKVGDPNI